MGDSTAIAKAGGLLQLYTFQLSVYAIANKNQGAKRVEGENKMARESKGQTKQSHVWLTARQLDNEKKNR